MPMIGEMFFKGYLLTVKRHLLLLLETTIMKYAWRPYWDHHNKTKVPIHRKDDMIKTEILTWKIFKIGGQLQQTLLPNWS